MDQQYSNSINNQNQMPAGPDSNINPQTPNYSQPNMAYNQAAEAGQQTMPYSQAAEAGQANMAYTQTMNAGQQNMAYNQTTEGMQQNADYNSSTGTTQQADYSRFYQNPYSTPQFVQPNGPEQGQPKKAKKTKNKGGASFGKTMARTVAVALTFSLVAGAGFTGIYAGGRALGIYGSDKNQEASADAGKTSNDSTEKMESSKNSSSAAVTQTSTGKATDLTDVSSIVSEVMPSIVAITNTGTVSYQTFFGTQQYESESCGSGIIISQDDQYLYIATNNHVVADSEELTVQFSDETTVSAEIQGTASSSDLAVIKVKLSDIDSDTLSIIKVATVGDSTNLQVGSATIAIGNALGYGQSVTTGVVSALNRSVTVEDSTTGQTVTNSNLIQTDAAINPGNSGGALLDETGAVIGINSAKYSDTSVEGIGYAIPISDAMEIINDLIENGEVTSSQTAYLGIQGVDVSSDVAQVYDIPEGVYVYSVVDGSGAADAGITKGDVITDIDGTTIDSMSTLQNFLTKYSEGDTVTVTLQRLSNSGRGGNDYQEMQIEVKLSGAGIVQE